MNLFLFLVTIASQKKDRITNHLRALAYKRKLRSLGKNTIFDGTHIILQGGRSKTSRGISIGSNCHIYDFCLLVTDSFTEECGISIGNNCQLNYRCYFSGTGGITIGNNCLFGPDVKIIASNHKFDNLDELISCQGHDFREIIIGDNVWVGAGAIILPGVQIEDGAVVAAGSVVTKNVSKNCIVAGVPAQKIRLRGSPKLDT